MPPDESPIADLDHEALLHSPAAGSARLHHAVLMVMVYRFTGIVRTNDKKCNWLSTVIA